MQMDIGDADGRGRQVLRREAARWWWTALIAGIAWFLIAWAVLRADVTSLATVGLLVGIVFLVAAVSESGMAAIAAGGWRAVHIVLSLVFLLGALWAFIRPINTFFALASALGLLVFIQGVFYISRAVAAREVSPFWWVGLVSGVLVVALGLWISASDRVWTLAARAVFVLLFVGFYAVFRGINDLVLAVELRRLGRGRPDDQQALGEPPDVPAQERRAPTASPRPDAQPEARSTAGTGW